MDHLRYPIGQFNPLPYLSPEQREQFINQIPQISISLRNILKDLNPGQLQIAYRPGGWNIQQIVHHMADNDMNAYLRFKWTLTEEEPIANSYREDLWAELIDYKDVPVETSLTLLEALHSRFLILLNGLNPDDFSRKLSTQVLGLITLDTALQRFVWHNRHHIAQINAALQSRVGYIAHEEP